MQALRISIALSYQSLYWETVKIALYKAFTNIHGKDLLPIRLTTFQLEQGYYACYNHSRRLLRFQEDQTRCFAGKLVY